MIGDAPIIDREYPRSKTGFPQFLWKTCLGGSPLPPPDGARSGLHKDWARCRPDDERQHDTHLLLFFAPSFTSKAMVSGNGATLSIGPLAMSAVVCPLRLLAFTSAPFPTR